MVVVLFPISGEEPRLQRAALEELARLGVTSIALLRDASMAGLVLEGWAFDPREAPQAACAVGAVREDVRLLQPLVQMGISPSPAGSTSPVDGWPSARSWLTGPGNSDLEMKPVRTPRDPANAPKGVGK